MAHTKIPTRNDETTREGFATRRPKMNDEDRFAWYDILGGV